MVRWMLVCFRSLITNCLHQFMVYVPFRFWKCHQVKLFGKNIVWVCWCSGGGGVGDHHFNWNIAFEMSLWVGLGLVLLRSHSFRSYWGDGMKFHLKCWKIIPFSWLVVARRFFSFPYIAQALTSHVVQLSTFRAEKNDWLANWLAGWLTD